MYIYSSEYLYYRNGSVRIIYCLRLKDDPGRKNP